MEKYEKCVLKNFTIMRIIYSQEMETFYIDLEKGIQETKVIYKYTHTYAKRNREDK